jgi:hypothetical protein
MNEATRKWKLYSWFVLFNISTNKNLETLATHREQPQAHKNQNGPARDCRHKERVHIQIASRSERGNPSVRNGFVLWRLDLRAFVAWWRCRTVVVLLLSLGYGSWWLWCSRNIRRS